MHIFAEHAPVCHAGISEVPAQGSACPASQPNRSMLWAVIFSLLLHGGLFLLRPPAMVRQTQPLPREIYVTLTTPPAEEAQPPTQKRVAEPSPNKNQGSPLPTRHNPAQKQTKPEPKTTAPRQAMAAVAREEPVVAKTEVPAEAISIAEDARQVALRQRNGSETAQEEDKPAEAALSGDSAPVPAAEDADSGRGGGQVVLEGDKGAQTNGIEASPLYQKNPPPDYPPLARKRGLEGTVQLDVLVNRDGSVQQVRLGQTSGHSLLDGAAVSAVEKWLFQPGQKGDETIDMWVRVPIRFALRHENSQDKP
ncbi:MAG: energy transducer TonB [Deltaproteobacteria bacterium]|nr:energy transducer TonB [Deltaproteobacteria bacterium]